jgi:hypothetical protein
MPRIALLATFLLAVSPAVAAQPADSTMIAQRHVLTEDFLGSPYGSTVVSPAQAAPFLTWAQVGVSDANAVASAGIKTQYYIDPALTVSEHWDPLHTQDESTYAHDCLGNRITRRYDRVTQSLMALEQPSMRAVFARWVRRVTAAVHYDALFEDDAVPPSEYLRFHLMPCGYNDRDWLRALDGLNATSPIPVIMNGLNASKRPMPSGLLALLSSPKTLGLNYESCYSGVTQTRVGGTIWQAMENSEIAVADAHKLFECSARDGAAAATSIDRRIYVYASFLLGYDPSTSILSEDFMTPSKFRVEPESQLVGLDPSPGQPGNVSDLHAPGGTYARRFARCYIDGRFVGSCAAVVNPSDSAQPFPYPNYNHTLVLRGGGILDGGTVDDNGPPPPSRVAPIEAVIAFRLPR